jgi:hypothetical protein
MRALLAASCRRRAAQAAQRAAAPASPATPTHAGIGARGLPCAAEAAAADAASRDIDAPPAGAWRGRGAGRTLLPPAAASALPAAPHRRCDGGCGVATAVARVFVPARCFSAGGSAGRTRLNPNYAPHARALAPAPATPAAPPQEARAAALPSLALPPRRLRALPRAPPDADNAGWTHAEVVNVPNALSLGRALSGPLIAVWVTQARPL